MKIIELNKEILEEKIESYMITLENLKGYEKINQKQLLNYFNEITKTSKILVALNEDSKIIGSITTIIEYKMIRGGVKAGRIEDLGIRKGYEGKGIGSKLLKEAIILLEKENVYKITLSGKEKVSVFYEKNGFERSSINFKKYIK